MQMKLFINNPFLQITKVICKKLYILIVAFFLIVCSSFTLAAHSQTHKKVDSTQLKKDIETIKQAVIQTGVAFNERNPDGILAHYAPDILVSYPNVADTDYAGFAEAFSGLRNRPPGLVSTKADIHEIIVSGDLAMVRVSWITTTKQADPAKEVTRRARDMQIWQRQTDGSWKFTRGLWFHEKPVEK